MPLEIYIISSVTSKKIIECGRINKVRDEALVSSGDGSAVYSGILKTLSNNNDLQVLYLPLSFGMPDQKKHKINAGNTKYLNKTSADIAKEEKEKLKIGKLKELASLKELENISVKIKNLEDEISLLDE